MSEGQVIGYGERLDNATMTRQAAQFQAAWNASGAINATSQTVIESIKPVAAPAQAPAATPLRNTNFTSIGGSVTCRSY